MQTGCVTLFGRERGADVNRMIEEATGEPCPCKQGGRCPLLPRPDDPPQRILHAVATGS